VSTTTLLDMNIIIENNPWKWKTYKQICKEEKLLDLDVEKWGKPKTRVSYFWMG